MIWNIRMVSAQRGIWKASELRIMLAREGLVVSAGKMSSLWSGSPVTVRLDDLEIICRTLSCEPSDLLKCARTDERAGDATDTFAEQRLG